MPPVDIFYLSATIGTTRPLRCMFRYSYRLIIIIIGTNGAGCNTREESDVVLSGPPQTSNDNNLLFSSTDLPAQTLNLLSRRSYGDSSSSRII